MALYLGANLILEKRDKAVPSFLSGLFCVGLLLGAFLEAQFNLYLGSDFNPKYHDPACRD